MKIVQKIRMRTAVIFLWMALAACCFGQAQNTGETPEPQPVMLEGFTSNGEASISPDTGVAGQFGAWTVTYRVGKAGVQTGGGIRVQLPDSWHAGHRNSANRLQATDPQDEHYVSAHSSRSDVKLETAVEFETGAFLVKHAKPSLDGRNERYVFVVRVKVVEGSLREGDSLSVVYGDRSGGSVGMLASVIATQPEPVLVAVDESGANRFRLLNEWPAIQSLPGEAAEMLFLAPSQAVVGEPARVRLSLLDSNHNPTQRSESISVRSIQGSAEFDRSVNLPPRQGYVTLSVTPTRPGILRLKAEADETGLVAISNPIRVYAKSPPISIYWGDLHSHARHSWDGVGDRPFQYARDIAGLDFYSLSDHSISPGERTRGLSEFSWKEYTALPERYNDPPRFVTLHAYEASFGAPYGHHIIYFRHRPGPLIYPQRVTLEDAWQMLDAGDALTIPHHTGKFPGGIVFSFHDPRFRRNFEIYSGHGLSEYYNPTHPLSFEHSKFTSDARSLPGPTFIQDVWRDGLALSAIASSDDHRGQPGQPHLGLVAVRAPELTRDAVFQAMYDRRTYATTGARILLDFRLNGIPMGQTASSGGSAPRMEIEAHGTGAIAWVELLRFQSGQERFQVVKRWEPAAWDFHESHEDTEFKPGAMYYARLQQRHWIRGKAVMAWSSPIWTDPKTLSPSEP